VKNRGGGEQRKADKNQMKRVKGNVLGYNIMKFDIVSLNSLKIHLNLENITRLI
jgi:hypothetical protein